METTISDKQFLKACKQLFKDCGYSGKIKSMSEVYEGGTFNAFCIGDDSATFATVYEDNNVITGIEVNTKYYSVTDKLQSFIDSL